MSCSLELYDRDFNYHLQSIHHRHHSQHDQSVTAAKQLMQERLSKLGGQAGAYQLSQDQSAQYGNAYGSSGSSQKYVVPPCSSCFGGAENREAFSSRYQIIFLLKIISASVLRRPNDFFTQFFDLSTRTDNKIFSRNADWKMFLRVKLFYFKGIRQVQAPVKRAPVMESIQITQASALLGIQRTLDSHQMASTMMFNRLLLPYTRHQGQVHPDTHRQTSTKLRTCNNA